MHTRFLAFALVALVGGAGCITIPDEYFENTAADSSVPPLPPVKEGFFSATERMEEKDEFPCLDQGLSLPEPRLYCAKRVTTVEGEMRLASLPVTLVSGFTDVRVLGGSAGEWRMALTVTAGGESADEARANLAAMDLVWSKENAQGYALEARVETKESDVRARTLLELTLPPEVLYGMAIRANSADVHVEGLTLRGLEVETNSGDIVLVSLVAEQVVAQASSGDIGIAVEAETLRFRTNSGDVTADLKVAQLHGRTTSGDMEIKLQPTRSGGVSLDTSSGDIELGLPENARQGYDLVATTNSGDISIGLEDGRASEDARGERATFQTDGYSRRDVRTTVALGTSSGDIDIAPTRV